MKRFPGPPRSPVRRLPTVPTGMNRVVSSLPSSTTVQGHTVWTIRCFRSTERHTTLSPGANSFTEALFQRAALAARCTYVHFVYEHHERRSQPPRGPRVAAPAAPVEACLGRWDRDRGRRSRRGAVDVLDAHARRRLDH